jgi:hypothetical protein
MKRFALLAMLIIPAVVMGQDIVTTQFHSLPTTLEGKPITLQSVHAEFVKLVHGSVVMLYRQSESGDMKMTCTATAYREIPGGYRLASASHCVEGKTQIARKQNKYFVTLDETGEKKFMPAKLIDAGNKQEGDDFSIFEVKTSTHIDVLPLGDSSNLVAGDQVVSVAAPLGLGKQYFVGYVTIPTLDRPSLDAEDVKWTDVIVIHIGSGPGSSGSAVVSEDQKAIVGFLVGHFGADVGAIVVPVKKFKAFEEAVDKGTYKHKSDPKDDDQ